MKNLLLLITFLFTINLVQAQCYDYNCNISYFLPIAQEDINGINNTPGNKCFVNNTTVTHQVSNQINFNNWTKMTFATESTGGMIVNQTLNVNPGKEVYLKGSITLSQLNMSAGGGDSSIVYVENNSQIFINSIQFANNTHNYVYLGTGVTFTMAGETWTPGEVFHLTSNPTNIITFVQCETIPLAIEFQRFMIYENKLYWYAIDSDSFSKPLLEIRKYDEKDKFWRTIHIDDDLNHCLVLKESGIYQGYINGVFSNAVEYKHKEIYIPIRDIFGNIVTDLQPNTFYWKGTNKFIIIK